MALNHNREGGAFPPSHNRPETGQKGLTMPYEMVRLKTVIVTRHSGLVEFLREEGIIDQTATVLAHASPDQVRGCRVIGILPLALAAVAGCVEQPVLDLPPELRGKELSTSEVREHFRGMESFVVFTKKEACEELQASNDAGHQGYGRTLGKWEPHPEWVAP